MRLLFVALLLLGCLAFLAPSVYAQSGGLVPCSGTDCNACHLVELGDNILDFLIQLSILIATVMFAWGGFQMVTSAGNPGKVSSGTGKMTDAMVGIVIVLAAWLLIDTALKLVLDEQVLGVWNDISCTGGQVAP